jgi:hypothetical protein
MVRWLIRLMSSRLLLVVATVAVLGLSSSADAADSTNVDPRLARAQAIQQLVNNLKARLAISETVVVSIAQNALVASVGRSPDRQHGFDLVFDDKFLAGLDDDELNAAIAHELGHVWIFTHHPYLQTEELANEIALRLVTRDSLERLYQKVWSQGGKGDLQYLPTGDARQ